MRHWKIARARDVEPTRGPDRDTYARTYVIVPVGGGDESQTTVEFVAGGQPGSVHRAMKALRPFLDQETRPPRQLLVGREGRVSVLDNAE
jgi:hypothetical protein